MAEDISALRDSRPVPAQPALEIARLRLATDEGSLRVRADRIWDVAVGILRKAEIWT